MSDVTNQEAARKYLEFRLWLRGYLIGALMNDDPALRERIESLRDKLAAEGE